MRGEPRRAGRRRVRRSRQLLAALLALSVARAAIASGSPAVAPASSAPGLSPAELEAFADRFFADYLRESARPSLAVVVVHGGRVLLQKGYGFEAEAGARPVDPRRTVFHSASLSKLFVATAALQLVERGRLALDADLAPLAEGFTIPSRPGEPVTLAHLLTHTSGLEGPLLGTVVDDPAGLAALGDYLRAHPPRRAGRPGAEVRYSSYGMTLAAYLVERASGERFETYVERHVFEPLGMRRSSFRQPVPAPLRGRLATAGAGLAPDLLQLYPAGALVATPSDMGRFMAAQLGAGRAPILHPETLALMHATHWTAHPAAPGVAHGFFETRIEGVPALFHTGARVHFSLLVLAPEASLGVFVVHSTRQGGPFQSLRHEFVRALFQRWFGATGGARPRGPGRVEHPAPGGEGGARCFAGIYRPALVPSTTLARAAWLALDTRVEAEPDGGLRLALPFAGRALRFEPAGPALFRSEDDRFLAFSDPAGGRPDMVMSGSTQDPVSFTRLAWYERGLLHAGAALAGLLVVAAWLARAAAGRLRRRSRPAAPPAAIAAARWATLYSLLVVAAPASLAAAVWAGGGPTAGGATAVGLRLALTLLLAASLTAPVLAWRAFRALRAGAGGRGWRLHLATLAAVALLMVPFLAYYHLLGYRF